MWLLAQQRLWLRACEGHFDSAIVLSTSFPAFELNQSVHERIPIPIYRLEFNKVFRKGYSFKEATCPGIENLSLASRYFCLYRYRASAVSSLSNLYH
jgi:hypothetical protein